jgi:hypothetical protein
MYTSTNFPALKPASVHSIQLLSAVLISSLFAGAAAYGSLAELDDTFDLHAVIIVVVAVVFLSEMVLSFVCLKQSKESADVAIHR